MQAVACTKPPHLYHRPTVTAFDILSTALMLRSLPVV